jgi:glycosyltransferase involved in cell wall biosynthesis
MKLSIIIPIKDERDNLRPLYQQLCEATETLDADYEFVFVDDGSVDGSFDILADLALKDRCLKLLRLRRNVGQAAALKAGIDWSTGDVVVTMDGDLQHDAADIRRLVDKLAEGYDVVFGCRTNRRDNFLFRKVPSSIGNWLIRATTGVPVKDMGCTLRAMRRDAAKALPLYGEMHRFIPVFLHHWGAQSMQIPVRHYVRHAGTTKYSLSRVVRVPLDLVTVKFLHSYLTRPMQCFGAAGMLSVSMSFVFGAATAWMKVYSSIPIIANPLTLACAVLFILGLQLVCFGLIGELLARTYFESQAKPVYAVRDAINFDMPAPLLRDRATSERAGDQDNRRSPIRQI